MSEKELAGLQPRKPIAIIRLDDLTYDLEICRALLAGGITVLEFTLTNSQAINSIEKARNEFADSLFIGAGTVLDGAMAEASIRAGAQFLVTPTLLPEVIQAGLSHDVPVVCGAFTPTEILTAWRLGASLVKVFPAGRLGPGYLKDVLAPLPAIPLVPTGGVNLETCAAFLSAGAYTVAIGSQLVSKELVEKKDWATLTALARRYMELCSQG
ncbi:MAG TPA: bifunctional 4-hydroxy-2-oxoglutarate aldolase/2-dehydro-3-deoxy-phosphogluconate aldolase [Ktedonobacteraceae bacterium]|jgi:2-dehydro-3-deoxyphosphogluconate aldolase/(4S)-4-hydroxy-2-oxoglutarate aldolase|nr:bifunctional 4-hydroxy-2-oxoglutarate aldolase/2-dehydro-3-deoxy-phosphogluconate aldolase [Ktedonobacteraceae bacterium]